MKKLTKSLPLFKERGCTVSLALDIRTNRRKSSEYPLSVRFTLERRAFYYPVGGSYTAKEFSDICSAVKCRSENYKLQKEWKDTLIPKYKDILMNLNKGGILTYEMVRQRIIDGADATFEAEDAATTSPLNHSLAFGSKLSMSSEQKTVVYALPQPRATSVLSNHSGRFLEKMP